MSSNINVNNDIPLTDEQHQPMMSSNINVDNDMEEVTAVPSQRGENRWHAFVVGGAEGTRPTTRRLGREASLTLTVVDRKLCTGTKYQVYSRLYMDLDMYDTCGG